LAGLRSPTLTELRRHGQRAYARIGRAIAASVVVSGLVALGGCGIVVPLSSLMSSSPEPPPSPAEVTGSIPTTAATAPVSPDGDADSVRRALEISVARGVEAPIAWKNETNGHSGTVTASHAARAPNGAPCRDFETTLTTVSGVDLHSGRICQGFTGGWEVLRFERVGG